MQSVRSIGCSSHWVPRNNALKVWILRSLLRLCMLAWLKKSLLTVNLFPISILPVILHLRIFSFISTFPQLWHPPFSRHHVPQKCLESWALELECGMMVDTWIRIQPFFWQGKNWNQQRRVFLGRWWYKDIPKAIIDNYNYNILQYCHSSYSIQYHIHYSVWLSYKYIQISCHYCNGSTYISSEFPSKSPCWSQPPRLHGRASQLTMNFWGVDVERVKVLDQPMTKTQNSIFVILASLLSPPATPTTKHHSITSECLPSSIPNPCSVRTRHYQYVLL